MIGHCKIGSPRAQRVAAIRRAEFRALLLADRLLLLEHDRRERWAPLLPVVSLILRMIVRWAGSRR